MKNIIYGDGSEETASASDEMKAQVEKIRIFVNELAELIGQGHKS